MSKSISILRKQKTTRTMIKRLVKLTFKEDKVSDFLDLFEIVKTQIRGQKGCHHLELLRAGNVFFTVSIWDDVETLNKYRKSELFRATWPATKSLFAAPPEAWSTEVIWDAAVVQSAE